ncbi:MAG: hypothetical protein AAB920_03505 [Patescibacteria group bacterium]
MAGSNSIKESVFRFVCFSIVCAVCVGAFFYTLSPVHNPKQVFPEGFGFVVGLGVLCGFLGVVEGGVLLWRLGSYGLESLWK